MLKQVFFALFVFGILVNPSTTEAAKSWETMTANEFLQETHKALQTGTSTTEAIMVSALLAYKSEKDKSPVFYINQMDGLFGGVITSAVDQFDATSTIESGKGNRVTKSYQIKTLSDGTHVYVLFNNSKDKKLRTTWVKMTPKEYDNFGKKAGIEDLFEVNPPQNPEAIKRLSEKILAAQLKTNVLTIFPFEISDNKTVKNATRYNFEYDVDAIRAYFAELNKNLTLEEAKDFSLGTQEMSELLEDDTILQYMADRSYYSVWIDNTTKLPVGVYTNVWVAEKSGKKLKPVQIITDTIVVKHNSPKKVTAPTSTMSVAEAAKIFKIKLDAPKK